MRASILHALERFVLPNSCVSCERAIESRVPDALLCAICRGRMQPLPLGCPRCRQPLPPVGPCRFCATWPPSVKSVRSAVWLGREARALVHHLKYSGYPALADVAAELIARTVLPPRGSSLLAPIPLAINRLRLRGYNQAALIARALARRWGIPVADTLLWRGRDAASQTRLMPEDRARNVAGAFVAAPPHTGRPQNRRDASSETIAPRPQGRGVPPVAHRFEAAKGRRATVILVDDVLTTGATVAAAASALDCAGWADIAAVTFARARPFELRALQA